MKTKVENTYPKSRTIGLKKGGSVQSRSAIYNKLAVHSDRAIKELVKLLDSPNESIRLGAINKILDKVIPDVRSMELTGKDGESFTIKVISQFLYSHEQLNTSQFTKSFTSPN